MASDQDKPPSSKIPGTYKAFVKKFPALGRAHEDIAKAAEAGLSGNPCAYRDFMLPRPLTA